VAHVNAERRLLLGTVGWERADWLQGYYPPDLPAEWRLAYYANDCGCVLLPAQAWCAGDLEGLQQAIREAPDGLRLFLQMPEVEPADVPRRLAVFPPDRTVLLVAAGDPGRPGFRAWQALGPDAWADSGSGAGLVLWSLAAFDLRDLRARAERLDPRVQALLLDGAGADPGRIPELRRMLELMGHT